MPDTFAGRTAKRPDPSPAGAQHKTNSKGELFMVAYYENESAVDAALKAAKTAEEVDKILQDLEQRMAPFNWIQKALRVYWSMI